MLWFLVMTSLYASKSKDATKFIPKRIIIRNFIIFNLSTAIIAVAMIIKLTLTSHYQLWVWWQVSILFAPLLLIGISLVSVHSMAIPKPKFKAEIIFRSSFWSFEGPAIPHGLIVYVVVFTIARALRIIVRIVGCLHLTSHCPLLLLLHWLLHVFLLHGCL